ncbi:winged helix-turn-helix domain-containing protein [Halostella litorea]|uniref:winged helix-turn-helix domain-containing protein n=1 Tax=Halostella litorea TaxID=2528831 RepID=UPI001091D074|nr:winged helix-turn-helix domain-containing protein [Halostella litorea]
MGTDDADGPEGFAEYDPLVTAFGDHPRTRVVVALLSAETEPPTDFSPNEIARITGVEESAVEDHVASLRSQGLVVETDEIDGGPTYRLDEGDDAVAALRRLHDELFDRV